ncbi:aldo/keto reductase [Photorhabdus laumondii]|uniref:NADP-dependent oxidoreductase domain-containing protein n=1 Tax=Photorhabdus laumondii subsp. clarkei TaxID=2029685 RepID=A0A329VC33_9GAMM|nr:aldo/keto reductase [Photorhabdus laumondii]PQQ36112.1 hypothetical protein C6H68_21310 [Photorhabdus luminescens]RAW86109.1 hypothetical protein CKY01_18330 [Photorhabdus laumondii subsp. clarkei]
MNLTEAKLMLGTEHIPKDKINAVLDSAWNIGYRYFDTSISYTNNKCIAEALSHYPRSQFFINVKIALNQLNADPLEISIDKVLQFYKTDYLDSVLIHSPRSVDHLSELSKLNDLKQREIITHIGVSNYTVHHLSEIYYAGLRIDAVQSEIHPYLQELALMAFCKVKGISIMAHTPFAQGRIFTDVRIQELSLTYKTNVAGFVLAWFQNNGIIPVFSSNSDIHLKENFMGHRIRNCSLINDDIQCLNSKVRLCNGETWAEFEKLPQDIHADFLRYK